MQPRLNLNWDSNAHMCSMCEYAGHELARTLANICSVLKCLVPLIQPKDQTTKESVWSTVNFSRAVTCFPRTRGNKETKKMFLFNVLKRDLTRTWRFWRDDTENDRRINMNQSDKSTPAFLPGNTREIRDRIPRRVWRSRNGGWRSHVIRAVEKQEIRCKGSKGRWRSLISQKLWI